MNIYRLDLIGEIVLSIETKKIGDFLPGDEVDSYLLIKQSSVRISSNNKQYLDFTLIDKSGAINAKLWDCSDEDIALYSENQVVKIRGNIQEWKGVLQLKVNKMRQITEEDHIDYGDFIPKAPIESATMYAEIQTYVERIGNSEIKCIVNEILNEYREPLMYYPAAKSNHHSIQGGLMYHVVRMLRLGEKICEVYGNLNSDLVYAGIILHDIEKINEMESNLLGIVNDYTMEGKLLGHIVQGIKKIEIIAERHQVSDEVKILLQHMILSHHYEAEYGSPKKPMIPEAEVLHYVDIIDARMYDMFEALDKTNTGEFSDKIWALDNRQIYKNML